MTYNARDCQNGTPRIACNERGRGGPTRWSSVSSVVMVALVACCLGAAGDQAIPFSALDHSRGGRDFRASLLAPRARTPALVMAGRWGDKDRTREILLLHERIGELEQMVKTLSAKPGPAGPAGPGIDPAVLSAMIKRISELESWRGRFRATLRVRVSPVKGN